MQTSGPASDFSVLLSHLMSVDFRFHISGFQIRRRDRQWISEQHRVVGIADQLTDNRILETGIQSLQVLCHLLRLLDSGTGSIDPGLILHYKSTVEHITCLSS